MAPLHNPAAAPPPGGLRSSLDPRAQVVSPGEVASSPAAPLPGDEVERLARLYECRILDTPDDPDFDDLTALAAQICGMPVALISLIDETRQWFKSRRGLAATETPRELAFCAHAICDPGHLLIVPDATKDPRFSGNELVTAPQGIRFYAGAPLVMEGGHALGTLCVIDQRPRELTVEQQEALAALARQVVSQIRLRCQNFALREAKIEREEFFTRPLDMLCIAGADGFFKVLNPAFSETLGFTTEELLACPLFDFVHPEDRASSHAEMAQVLSGLPAVNFEHRFRCKDGSYRWLSWKCAPAPDGVLYASARDITESKQMAETLQQQRTELRVLFDYLPAFIVFKDTKNGLLRVNQRLADALGKTVAEIEGKSTEEIYPREAVKFYADDLEVIHSGVPKLGIVETFRDGEGKDVWIQTDKIPVRDREGKVIGLVAMAQDITERKNAEEQIRLSEALVRQFVTHAPAAIAMLDTEMRYLQVSERWLTDYHLEGQEIIGRSHYEVFPDVPEHWKHIHQRVLAGAIERCDEDPFPRADGGLEWLQWEARPWFQRGDEIGGVIFFTQVITARKAVEAELRTLNQLQRGILESAAYAIIAGDPDGTITAFNPAAERMLGYTAEEMVGRLTPAVFHDPEEVAVRARQFSRELGLVLEPGFEVFVAKARRRLPNEHEWTYLRKDGSRFPVQLTVTALWEGPETIIGFLGIASDITERKKAEAALIASERRFREAIEYSAIGMALVGLEGRWLEVNRALCAIVGRSETELQRCTFQDITHPDDLAVNLGHAQSLLDGVTAHYQMEKRYLHGDGHVVWVLLAVTLVRDAGGQPAYFVTQIQDITERHEAEQRLKASLEEKETLLKEVHHRVKNNLQVISSLLQLQSEGLTEPRLLPLFREAQNRVRAMALIHEGLYRTGNLTAVSFGSHLQELVGNLLRTYAAGSTPVRLVLETEPVELNIDLAMPLSLIVNELVTNSVKHAFTGREGGVLRVLFHQLPSGLLWLSIGDDGPGLPADYDWEKSASLGLKIVRILVAQIGGQLEVRRTPHPSFAITFPRFRQAPPR